MFFDNTSSCSSSPVCSSQKQADSGHFSSFSSNFWDKSSQRFCNFQPISRGSFCSNIKYNCSCQQSCECSDACSSSGNDGSPSDSSSHSSSSSSSSSSEGNGKEGNPGQQRSGKPCSNTMYDKAEPCSALPNYLPKECFYCGSNNELRLLCSSSQYCLLQRYVQQAFIISFIEFFLLQQCECYKSVY